MDERAHLSIGEVLSLLREEFPDVTISKIRFLESQGLVDPERTPSGYRKFYDPDVERLRWILRQQREHFLPLKVIKGRLSEASAEESEPASPAAGAAVNGEVPEPEPSGDRQAAAVMAGRAGPSDRTAVAETVGPDDHAATPAPAIGASRHTQPAQPETLFVDTASAVTAPPDSPAAGEPAASEAGGAPAVTSVHTDAAGTADAGTPAAALSPTPSRTKPAPAPFSSGMGRRRVAPSAISRGLRPDPDEVNLTLDELIAACGLDADGVHELEGFGLITSRDVGGTSYYSQDALTVANLAAGLASHGVGARHLRMYKNAAERESGLFEQIVMPLIKQRNPKAREQAAAALEDLARLGGELREALLNQALRDAF